MIATRAPSLFRRQNQIRPKLEFRQHKQRRPHATHRGPHGPTEIERAVEDREIGVLLPRQLEAGAARRRNEQSANRDGPRAAGRSSWPSDSLRRRSRRESKRRSPCPSRRGTRPSSFSAISFAILAGANRLPDDQRREHRQHGEINKIQPPREDSNHAGILSLRIRSRLHAAILPHAAFLYFFPLPQGMARCGRPFQCGCGSARSFSRLRCRRSRPAAGGRCPSRPGRLP